MNISFLPVGNVARKFQGGDGFLNLQRQFAFPGFVDSVHDRAKRKAESNSEPSIIVVIRHETQSPVQDSVDQIATWLAALFFLTSVFFVSVYHVHNIIYFVLIVNIKIFFCLILKRRVFFNGYKGNN